MERYAWMTVEEEKLDFQALKTSATPSLLSLMHTSHTMFPCNTTGGVSWILGVNVKKAVPINLKLVAVLKYR